MNTPRTRPVRISAFTLIELLVVIGLIGLLAGGLGVAMSNKNPGTGLRTAQSTLVSVLASARGQAAMNQADAMILVQADPAEENFLRAIKVVVQKRNSSTGLVLEKEWVEVGGEVVLPEGAYVVPPVKSMTGVSLSSPDPKRLSLFVSTSTVKGASLGLQRGTYFQSLHLTPLGSVSVDATTTASDPIKTTGGRMLVAVGKQTSANAWSLDNANAVRGFVVSIYGVASLINNAATLDNP